jgi:hypothetical protein
MLQTHPAHLVNILGEAEDVTKCLSHRQNWRGTAMYFSLLRNGILHTVTRRAAVTSTSRKSSGLGTWSISHSKHATSSSMGFSSGTSVLQYSSSSTASGVHRLLIIDCWSPREAVIVSKQCDITNLKLCNAHQQGPHQRRQAGPQQLWCSVNCPAEVRLPAAART